MGLFLSGDFTLHSGGRSKFLIECDALSERDLDALAALAASRVPAFGRVVGIPRGGLRFAAALERYATEGPAVLIADDVWTTGASMMQARETEPNSLGVVMFARHATPWWVLSLFTMTEEPTP